MRKRCATVLSCLAVTATAFSRADDSNLISNASPIQMVAVVSQAAAAPTTEFASKSSDAAPEPIAIDYNEAELQSVLRTLAVKAGVNLILGDEVTGKVTVHLENVSYEEAMQLIAESKGYAYIKDKNVVRVKSKESVEAEPVEVRVRTLNYAKAEDVKNTINPLLTKQGKIQVDTRSNTLIISDTPSNLTKLIPLLDTLDTQTPQVLIEAKFIDTVRNPQKDLGINWSQTLLNHEVVAGGSALSDTPGDPPKIVTGPDNKPLSGFQWAKGPGGAAFSPWTAGAALLDVGRASLIFSYLSRDLDSELLANPRIVTTDNGKARISISTQYPIPQFAFSEQSGGFQITGFDYKDIGIILNVLPRINKNEFVTLEVNPEVSSSTENATLTSGSGNAVEIPIINTRVATTTVLIKSGNTLAIGGLMRQDSSDNYTKVPLLGDLPGVGPLFRSKRLNKNKRNLLIFLTPTIVGPDAQTGYEQYIGGFPPEEVYTNDKSMPRDNAKPRSVTKMFGGGTAQDQSSRSTQNFGSK